LQAMTMNENYTFRLVVPGDLALLSEWLKTPEVSRWYEDPDYKKGNANSGVDDIESIPAEFGGVVWTNRIDIIGRRKGIEHIE